MEIDELRKWAEEHHHPQLVLAESDIVKSGPFAWKRLLSDTSGRIEQALERISAFLERQSQEHLQVRLSCSLDEFDAEIARLRGILDAYMPYDAVEDAELVLEQYQE